MSKDRKPVANPLVVLREEFDDWAILFNPENGDAVGVNPVGVLIWKCLDGKHGIGNIVSRIGENFSQIPETADQEVAVFLDDLIGRGFVGHELGEKGA